MANEVIRFIRKNGRVIPIRAPGGSGALKAGRGAITARRATKGAAGGAFNHKIKRQDVQVHKAYDMAGLGLSVASGALGAATFSGGIKTFAGGALATHAIDAVGIAANAASVRGHGKLKERAKQFAKQEGRNLLVGNAVFVAGLVGMKRNREAIKSVGKGALNLTRRILKRGV